MCKAAPRKLLYANDCVSLNGSADEPLGLQDHVQDLS